MEAIAYSKKHLAPWVETHEIQIRSASALFAFGPDTTASAYRVSLPIPPVNPKQISDGLEKRLYDPSRWLTLITAFRTSVYSLNSLPSSPLLHLSLYAGLAALKLPTCFSTSDSPNVDCPVCDHPKQGLGVLAEEVPLCQHQNSSIVCRITGKIMDHDNMPLAFPLNGQVYSREALEALAAKRGDGIALCPRTGEECALADLRKVFIS